MVKKNMICILCSAFIMLFLPWCAVTFVKGDGGMAVCFLLFFAIDPMVAVCVGISAGKKFRAAWFQSLLLSALFLFGTRIFFDRGERAFLLYAAAYLLLGYSAAAISAILGKK